METSRNLTIQAKKYDGRVRKTWHGGVVSESTDLLILVAKFEEDVHHNDLGHIRAGTVSFEYFKLDKWYNMFRFHHPTGELLAYYINISMPPILEGNTLSYVDLDIDVVVWPNKLVEVLDRDDFEKNQLKYGYPEHVVAGAEDALNDVLGIIKEGSLP
jgi:uncharacterized protein